MNLTNKIVFLDLDGTLLNSNAKISNENVKTIQKLDKLGIPVILTSGRMPKGVYPFVERLGIKKPLITFGGSSVLDENGNSLYSTGLDKKTVLEVYNYAKDLGSKTSFNFYIGDNWYTTDLDHPAEIAEYKQIGFKPEQNEPEIVMKDEDLSIKCLFTGFEDEIAELEIAMRERFPNLKVMRSQPTLLEIMNPGISKAHGIDVILDYYGIPIENSIGIGDNYNDLEMLQHVNFPIIMENSPESLKQEGKYTITKSNDNNGVSYILEKLLEGSND